MSPTVNAEHGTLAILGHCSGGFVIGADSGVERRDVNLIAHGTQKIFQVGRTAACAFLGALNVQTTSNSGVVSRTAFTEEAADFLKNKPDITLSAAVERIAGIIRIILQKVSTQAKDIWEDPSNRAFLLYVYVLGFEGTERFIQRIKILPPPTGSNNVSIKIESRVYQASEFLLLPRGIDVTVRELLHGNSSSLAQYRRYPIVRKFREREKKGRLQMTPLSDLIKLIRICLEVTESAGHLLDPKAKLIKSPYWIGQITPEKGFRWALERGK